MFYGRKDEGYAEFDILNCLTVLVVTAPGYLGVSLAVAFFFHQPAFFCETAQFFLETCSRQLPQIELMSYLKRLVEEDFRAHC